MSPAMIFLHSCATVLLKCTNWLSPAVLWYRWALINVVIVKGMSASTCWLPPKSDRPCWPSQGKEKRRPTAHSSAWSCSTFEVAEPTCFKFNRPGTARRTNNMLQSPTHALKQPELHKEHYHALYNVRDQRVHVFKCWPVSFDLTRWHGRFLSDGDVGSLWGDGKWQGTCMWKRASWCIW